jgi:tRNA(fMet)-specific endonuclease VapC
VLHLLDTSVCVSLIRGRAATTALPPSESCIVSAITSAELEVGIHRSGRPREQRLAVDGLLACFTVLPFDSSAASHYGEIRAELERKGTVIGPLDLLIAAHARALGATVVTGNVREFKRVRGLKVLAWK